MLSLGHDHNAGQLTIHATEDMTDAATLGFLRHATKALEDKIAAKN